MIEQTTIPWPASATKSSTLDNDAEKLPWKQWLNVTQLNERVRDLLEDALPYVRVRGEISDLRQPGSGHIYFTLLDEKSRIRAVIWRGNRHRLRIRPRAGEAVQITGRIAVYPPRGEYQIIVEGMQPGGAGSERERLLQLHDRLKAEGLFETTRKKPLPFLPHYIGVVTSSSGAAIHDIKRGLENRFPGYYQLLIENTRVQGDGAAEEMIAALKNLIQDGRAEVIICGRGGGSAEDLAAFNHEQWVRTIADSPIPIVSAVGHEIDWTLSDWVADARAATPTAAAEKIMPDKNKLLATLNNLQQRLTQAARISIQQQRHTVKLWQQRLIHPRRSIELFRVRCDELTQRLLPAMQRSLQQHQQPLHNLNRRLSAWAQGSTISMNHHRLQHAQQGLQQSLRRYLQHKRKQHDELDTRLTSVSPLTVLQRGYAIVYDQQGRLPRDTSTLQTGETLRVVLAQGELQAVITQMKKRS